MTHDRDKTENNDNCLLLANGPDSPSGFITTTSDKILTQYYYDASYFNVS